MVERTATVGLTRRALAKASMEKFFGVYVHELE